VKEFEFTAADIEKFKSAPTSESRVGATPRKIQLRRKNFAMVPMWWVEKLVGCSGHTYHVALYVLHQDWRNNGKPFKLPNGMLQYDGVSRQLKWLALRRLERLGLIAVERRNRKSPVVRVLLTPPLSKL
jgi:hypothetical protein